MENISYQNSKNYDIIENLPLDNSEPSSNDLKIVNTLFTPQNQSQIGSILAEAKDAIVVGILFIIFSLPYIDSLINKFIPITNGSVFILTLFKAIFIIIVFWLIKHFYLSKKT